MENVLHTLRTTEDGLTSAQASERWHHAPPQVRRNQLLAEIRDQVRTPLFGILAAGAGLSLALGATGDVLIIGATIVANVAVGVWQEHKANRVAEALQRMGTSTAQVPISSIRQLYFVLAPQVHQHQTIPADSY